MKHKLNFFNRFLLLLLAMVTMGVDSASAGWTRVTKVSDLTSGGTFIIGYEATAKSGTIVPMQNTGTATTTAAGIMNSGTGSSTGNGTITMSTVTETSAYEVTIAASTSVDGAITIKCGDNYLGNTNTKNNCKLFTSESTTTAFGVTIGTNDVCVLKIAANATYHTLQYNNGSPRFAVYGGAQKNVVIYKKTCDITLTAGTNGAIEAYSDNSYASNKKLTITDNKVSVAGGSIVYLLAKPADGYKVETWSSTDFALTDGADDTKKSFTASKNGSISVAFKQAAAPTVAYTVSFDAQGHGTAPTALTETSAGAGITLPSMDNVTGYTFGGWATTTEKAAAGTADAGQAGETYKPGTDCTLYAVWTINKHKVTYVLGDGSGCSDIAEQAYGTEVTVCTTASLTHYTLSSWNVTKGGVTISAGKFTMPDADVELTAVWTENEKVTITFLNNGTAIDATTRQIYKGQSLNDATWDWPTLESSAACDDESNTFIGWTDGTEVSIKQDDPIAQVNKATAVNADLTLRAIWAEGEGVSNIFEKITSTSDLEIDGEYMFVAGSAKALNSDVYSTYYLTATDVTISNNTIENNNAKLIWTIANIDEGDILLSSNDNGNYLQIKKVGNYYNLVANSDSEGSESYFTPAISNGNWTLEAYSCDGYYVYYNSSYTEFTASTSSTSLQFFKRGKPSYSNYLTKCCTKWTAPTFTYAPATIAVGGGTLTPTIGDGTTYGERTFASSDPDIATVNETTGVVTPVKPGQVTITASWAGDEDYCAVDKESNQLTITGTLTVEFYKNGEDVTGTMENQEVTYGQSTKIKKNVFEKPGHDFAGWRVGETETIYQDEQVVQFTDDTKLYAQWTPRKHSVTFTNVYTGGTVTVNTSSTSPVENVTYNSVVTVATTDNTHYTLATLTYQVGSETPIAIDLTTKKFNMPDADVTIAATWNPDPSYTVTFHTGNTSSTQTDVWNGTLFSEIKPADPAGSAAGDCADTFIGWATSAIDEPIATEEAAKTAVAWVTASTAITSTQKDFYAVFAKASTGGTASYKVTTTLTVGKTYIFGAVKAAASATLANNTTFGAVAFTNNYNATSPTWGARVDLTPNSSGVVATTNVTDACKWTLESVTDGNYAFKKGTNYLYIHTSAGSSSAANVGLNTTAKVYLEDKTSICKDAFVLHSTSENTSTKMLYNTSNGYRAYNNSQSASATMAPYVRFYEYDPGVTYSNYVTTCCTKHDVKAGTMTVGGFVASPESACSGKSVTITANAVTGYNFTNWTVTGATPASESANPTTFTMPDEDVTVVANYSPQKHNVILHKNVTPDVTDVTEFTYGVAQNLNSISTLGWTVTDKVFAGWADNAQGTGDKHEDGASYTLTAEQDVDLYATWVADHLRPVTYAPVEHLTYDVNNPKTVDAEATEFSLTYAVDAHYQVTAVAVTVGGTALESGVAFTQTGVTVTKSDGFGGAISVTPTLAAIMRSVTWKVNGTATTAGDPTTSVQDGQKVTTLPTDPESCDENTMVFRGWTNNTIDDQEEAPAILFADAASAPVVEGNVTYHAVFAEKKSGSGTFDPSKSGEYYIAAIDKSTDPAVTYYSVGTANEATIASTTDIASATRYTFELGTGDNAGKFAIKSGSTYIKYTDGRSSNKTWVNESNTAYYWTIAAGNVDGRGSYNIKSGTSKRSLNYQSYNTTDATHVFGAFSTDNIKTTATDYYYVELIPAAGSYAHYSTTCIPPVEAPTLTETGTACGSKEVTISQTQGLSGLKIYYNINSDDDPTSSSTEYTAPFSVTENSTVKAIAICGPKSSAVASATYTILTEYTLAQATEAATTDAQTGCFTFTDLLVNGKSLSTAYLTDGTHAYVIQKGNHGFAQGDKLSATKAQLNFIKANGRLTFTSTDGITVASSGNATTPTAKTITDLSAANYGELVTLSDVTYNATDVTFSDGTNTIKYSNSLVSSMTIVDGAKYNLTGIVVIKDDAVAIAARGTTDLVSTATKLSAPTNLASEATAATKATLSWTAVDGATKYYIVIKKNGTQVKDYNTTDGTKTSYSPIGLEPGTEFTWTIQSIGDQKATANSDPAAGPAFTTFTPAHLVFMNGDDVFAETNAVNDKVVLPDTKPESKCGDLYSDFIHWINAPIEGIRTTKITQDMIVDETTSAAASATPHTYTYYAAFGKVKTAAKAKYDKVTEAPKDKDDNIDWTGEYLLMNGSKAFNSVLDELDAKDNYISGVTIAQDTIAETEQLYNARFVISKSATEGHYCIKTSDDYYIGNSLNGNNLYVSDETAYKNEITMDYTAVKVTAKDNNTPTYLQYNSQGSRFRYMTGETANITFYKRVYIPATYSAYITTCPQTYAITQTDKTEGTVTAPQTEGIEAGAQLVLTATANDGYTTTGGTWKITKTGSDPVEDVTADVFKVSTTTLTMPAYNVTIDYNFVAKVDKFVDNLHGSADQSASGAGAGYSIPSLSNTTAAAKCDAYYQFIGWVEQDINSGEPATTQPVIFAGTYATGATYNALWKDGTGKFITECCNTAVPENFRSLSTYLKATSAKLDWNNVTDATKYHVLVLDDKAETIADADVTESEYALVGLTANTTYTATVKAYVGCWGFETEEIEFKTAEQKSSYAVTINASNGTYSIDPELQSGKIEEGATVTITDIAPADVNHYFSGLTITPEVSDLIEVDGNYMFTMPSNAITIAINFPSIPTITWVKEGTTVATTAAVQTPGTTNFTIGIMQAAPTTWSYKDEFYKDFAGWLIGTDVENPIFANAGTAVPSDGLTLNAAFAKSADIDYDNLEQVTTTIDENAQYLIGAEQSADDNTMWYFNDVVNKEWGKMAKADATTDKPQLMTVKGTADALTIQDQSGKYLAGATSKFSDMSDEPSTFYLDNSEIIYKPYSTGYKLRHNYNSGSGGLRWYDGTTGKPAYLYKATMLYKHLTIDPAEHVTERTLKVDEYSTICLEQGAKEEDIFGMSLWTIEKATWSNEKLYSITIVKHEGDMVAGVPYIICGDGEADKRFVVTSGDIATAPVDDNTNGLHGKFVKTQLPANDGYYVISNGTLYLCGNNSGINAHRAYIKADEITDKSSQSSPVAVRRIIGGMNTPTLLENIFGNGETIQKLIINNQLIIIREGQMYNAAGAMMK